MEEVQSSQKPREERPYQEIIPELDVSKPLRIVRDTQASSESRDAGSLQTSSSLLSSISNILCGVVGQLNRIQSRDSTAQEEGLDGLKQRHEKTVGPDQLLSHLVPVNDGPVLFPKSSTDKIPKGSFRTLQSDNHDKEGSFKLPERHFIRYLEPSEEELLERREYDMDELDKCWIDLVNSKLSMETSTDVLYENFERIIDKLEKEWFHLTKDIFRSAQEPLAHEESVCSICNDGECENANSIVFCDGCNLAVHQECYGVPYIPEGQWLCRKCMLAPESNVSCIFCPNEGGAFKQTTTNQWAHVLCSIWIPEVNIANPIYMEPIEGVERVPKSRWKLVCSICKRKEGACIQCYKQTCFTAFHVTCARKAGLFMKVKHSTTSEDTEHVSYRALCRKHGPANQSESSANAAMNVHLCEDEECEPEWEKDNHVTNKQPTRLVKSDSKTGLSSSTVVAPKLLLDKCIEYCDHGLKNKKMFSQFVCKFWSLKRQSRKGTPLLKRLHLEPWTAFSSEVKQSETLKIARFRALSHFRDDLERSRILCDLVKRREREKLKYCHSLVELVYLTHAPLLCIIRRSLEVFKKMDKARFFWEPVRAEDVPDYHDIIRNPMDFAQIEKKIDLFDYNTLDEFQADLELIVSNALVYNKPNTPYARHALKIRSAIPVVIANAQSSLGTVSDLDMEQMAEDFFKLPSITATADQHHRRQVKDVQRKWSLIPVIDERLAEIISDLKESHSNSVTNTSSPASDSFRPGDLVWAKLVGYPWFPAEIVDPQSSAVPDAVKLQGDDNHFLGSFFDRDLGSKRSWVWMPVDKLCKFDYGAKDASMVEQALKKTQAMKKQVILAYLVACLSREQDPYRVFEMANITAN